VAKLQGVPKLLTQMQRLKERGKEVVVAVGFTAGYA
jgi:hypothetical protein